MEADAESAPICFSQAQATRRRPPSLQYLSPRQVRPLPLAPVAGSEDLFTSKGGAWGVRRHLSAKHEGSCSKDAPEECHFSDQSTALSDSSKSSASPRPGFSSEHDAAKAEWSSRIIAPVEISSLCQSMPDSLPDVSLLDESFHPGTPPGGSANVAGVRPPALPRRASAPGSLPDLHFDGGSTCNSGATATAAPNRWAEPPRARWLSAAGPVRLPRRSLEGRSARPEARLCASRRAPSAAAGMPTAAGTTLREGRTRRSAARAPAAHETLNLDPLSVMGHSAAPTSMAAASDSTKASDGDSTSHLKRSASASASVSASAVERITVTERDFRRCAGDLSKLRGCQVLPWPDRPHSGAVAGPACDKAAFERKCRSTAELRDPWRAMPPNPEMCREPSELDMTINEMLPRSPVKHPFDPSISWQVIGARCPLPASAAAVRDRDGRAPCTCMTVAGPESSECCSGNADKRELSIGSSRSTAATSAASHSALQSRAGSISRQHSGGSTSVSRGSSPGVASSDSGPSSCAGSACYRSASRDAHRVSRLSSAQQARNVAAETAALLNAAASARRRLSRPALPASRGRPPRPDSAFA